ncbi:MAG: decarboxylating NADP(+)-dependent phosphogluconate dehydrogenase [Planctomycetia bacterium]|jgi:6-phosphogluconate dehydrogenase|nr:decarboxylating NADP(+)-dependent phosphogluconate dehydrogenase [Planctomycetia bacterium]
MPEPSCDIGLIGLAVMGENLALNIASRGYSIAVYNRTTSVTDTFTGGRGNQPEVVGCHSLEALVAALKPPRKVMLMVKAGPAVDQIIQTLLPLLSPGDVIIDGGNTLYSDTERRTREVEAAGLLYVGAGVSGGEEGALKGPSLMPGGSSAAWPLIQPIFQAIAAKVGPQADIPCCDWVGPRGAGHYVKMVHNGIEYGDMQLICEAYWLLKHAGGLDNDALAAVFDEWNRGELDSYLIEITRDIFTARDPDGSAGSFLVDHILDRAGAKGTGKWMSQLALDLGVPSTLVTEAVYARCLSARKEARVRASELLEGPTAPLASDPKAFVDQVRQALYASKIASYAQGFVQLAAAAAEHDWQLDYRSIAMLWRGGCIIRAQFLDRIAEAYDADPELENLMLAPYFTKALSDSQAAWRQVVATAAAGGIPTPAFMTALAYYDGYRSASLPANLLQAQRDYFGAHTYERTDRAGSFHSEWLELRRPVS